ncbi:MAG: dephospho-CoA kinase [Micromonosporaceae bacterium]|nr:dephospho-CoA kinase [Micromonosporaceae bacterium]
MLIVGLTGGIGAGKSAVCDRLATHGAVVIDADRLARAVVEPGSPGLAEVVSRLGHGVLGSDGALDRRAVAALVFRDQQARSVLEGIIHPRVVARSRELAERAPADAVVVNDVPLLVEAGLGDEYDLVIVVQADEEVRLSRLITVRGMTEAEARARIAAQATDAQRASIADIVIENNGSYEELMVRVDHVWRDLHGLAGGRGQGLRRQHR